MSERFFQLATGVPKKPAFGFLGWEQDPRDRPAAANRIYLVFGVEVLLEGTSHRASANYLWNFPIPTLN